MTDSTPKTSSNLVERPILSVAEDRLGLSSYITALSEYISNAETPTTIAIQGDWGTGKTSFMNAIRNEVCVPEEKLKEAKSSDSTQDSAHYDNKPFYAISLNVWEHSMLRNSNEAVELIIKSILTELKAILPASCEDEHNQIATLIELSNLRAFAQSAASLFETISIGCNTGILAIIVNYLMSEKTQEKLKFLKNLKFLQNLKFMQKRAHSDNNEDLFMPAKFKQEISKVIQACLNSKNGKQRKGFVIFIDDLDRIDPESAVSILDMLKNFFDVDHCIFVLAIDYNVVVQGLKSKLGELDDNDERTYQSYFDKIIQLSFNVPTEGADVSVFLAESLERIQYAKHEDHNVILAKESILTPQLSFIDAASLITELSIGTNPRSIKRLLNNLSLSHILYKARLSSDKKTVQHTQDELIQIHIEKIIIYAFVCIQIAYPDVYKLLLKEADFINWSLKTTNNAHLVSQPSTLDSIRNIEAIRDIVPEDSLNPDLDYPYEDGYDDDNCNQCRYKDVLNQTFGSSMSEITRNNICDILDIIRHVSEQNNVDHATLFPELLSIASTTARSIPYHSTNRYALQQSLWTAFDNYAEKHPKYMSHFIPPVPSANTYLKLQIRSECHNYEPLPGLFTLKADVTKSGIALGFEIDKDVVGDDCIDNLKKQLNSQQATTQVSTVKLINSKLVCSASSLIYTPNRDNWKAIFDWFIAIIILILDILEPSLRKYCLSRNLPYPKHDKERLNISPFISKNATDPTKSSL